MSGAHCHTSDASHEDEDDTTQSVIRGYSEVTFYPRRLKPEEDGHERKAYEAIARAVLIARTYTEPHELSRKHREELPYDSDDVDHAVSSTIDAVTGEYDTVTIDLDVTRELPDAVERNVRGVVGDAVMMTDAVAPAAVGWEEYAEEPRDVDANPGGSVDTNPSTDQ